MHRIGQHVKGYYDRLYKYDSSPSPRLPIHQGKDLGAALGYPLDILKDLPNPLWDHFLPCGNPLQYLHPKAGDSILNLGSGVGIDSMALVRALDLSLKIVNLDVIFGVLARSRAVALELGFGGLNPSKSSISCVCAEGELLPFRKDSFEWVVMNGVLNLFPDKKRLLGEVHHVLKSSGRLVVMDLCAAIDLPDYFEEELDAWAWCMSGACTKSQLMDMLKAAGLTLELFTEIEDCEMLFPMGLVARKVS